MMGSFIDGYISRHGNKFDTCSFGNKVRKNTWLKTLIVAIFKQNPQCILI